jgi:hypothetical protein
MKYLAILMILFPMVVFAENPYTNCDKISGTTCRDACLNDEFEIKEMKIMEGEHKGKDVNLVCTVIPLDKSNELSKKGIELTKKGKKTTVSDLKSGQVCCTKKSPK